MENQENVDKLTEARSSREMDNSIFRRIFQNACSCFLPCLFRNSRDDDMLESKIPYQKGQLETNQLRDSKNQKSMMSEQSSRFATSWDDRKQFLVRSVYQHANRLLQNYDQSLDKSTIKKWHSYSIYQYRENQLLSLGTSNGRVLCKISCARVQPSCTSKKKTNQSRSYERSAGHFTTSNFDKYWNRRYFLFQRFDEGISLDDQSWHSVTPEAVAEYVAGKIRCDTVLDGFCGVGGNALKLANTCSRVICNDVSRVKLKCLETNAKVYCVENIQMLNEDFLQLEGIQPDVVFLSLPPGSQQSLSLNSIEPKDLKPPFDKIFAKAIRMSKNIVMLLPPNINIHKLGELIAKQYIESGIPSSTCSIKIEKIFFCSNLKYLAVYLGSVIENQMNLNDELCYIYNYLKEKGKKNFTHKKIIRYLRQKFGMIFLLNLVFDLNKSSITGTLIQRLYAVIRERNLISQQKLDKLIAEQAAESEIYNRKKIPFISQNQIVEEEKYVAEETDKQLTLSYYSQSSGNKGLRDSKIEEANSQNRSMRSSTSKMEEVIEQIARSNTVQFCPNRGSLIQDPLNTTNGDSPDNVDESKKF